jgi:ABC-2 type transport system permease protein
MTAPTITAAPDRASDARLLGLGTLIRKEMLEWRRARRAWVIAIVTSAFMALTALSTWINTTLREAFPADDQVDLGPISLDPLSNLVGAVNGQVWVLAAVFGVAGLLIRERETGTLAWVASKPVSRGAIFLAKWLTASLMLTLFAVLVPLLVTVAVVVPTYGVPDPTAVVALAMGMTATVVFFAAAGLMFSTLLPSQIAVAAAGLALFALPLFVGVVPALVPFLPQSMLTWPLGLVSGAPLNVITPIAYLAITTVVVLYGIRRMQRLEL